MGDGLRTGNPGIKEKHVRYSGDIKGSGDHNRLYIVNSYVHFT